MCKTETNRDKLRAESDGNDAETDTDQSLAILHNMEIKQLKVLTKKLF